MNDIFREKTTTTDNQSIYNKIDFYLRVNYVIRYFFSGCMLERVLE